MALSEFRKKKLNQMFGLFDVNGDGVMSIEDFGRFLDNVEAEGAVTRGTPKYERMQAQITAMWNNLREKADTNHDDKITREEWLAWNSKASDEAIAGGGGFPLQGLMEPWLDLIDLDGDGWLTIEEYKLAARAWNMKDLDVDHIYKTFVKSDRVTKETVLGMMTEHYFSEDPTSPVTHVYGTVQ